MTPTTSGGATRRRKFRPDLTDYDIFIMALVDKLNENSVYKMSKTDAVKFAVEKAVKTLLPDVVIQSGNATLNFPILNYESLNVHAA